MHGGSQHAYSFIHTFVYRESGFGHSRIVCKLDERRSTSILSASVRLFSRRRKFNNMVFGVKKRDI